MTGEEKARERRAKTILAETPHGMLCPQRYSTGFCNCDHKYRAVLTALASTHVPDVDAHLGTLQARALSGEERDVLRSALVGSMKSARSIQPTPAAGTGGDVEGPLTPYGEALQALEALTFAEASYRSAHDLYGDGSREAGREWDLMRRAGDRARSLIKRHCPAPPARTGKGA